MRVLEQPSSQCFRSSRLLLCSWAAACTLSIGQRGHSGWIHNVIVLALPSHILIHNNALPVICQETKSIVSDDFKVSLLPDNPPWMLHFECLESCVRCQEAAWIGVGHLSIIIQFLPNMIDYIVCWRSDDVIHRTVAVTSTHRHLGTRCACGMLATIHDAKKHWVV